MGTDANAPVIVGAGQITDRYGALSPPALMVEAARRAIEDAGGAGSAMQRPGCMAAVDCLSWKAADPAAFVARELGIEPRETVRTVIGGNGPLALIGDLSDRIRSGALDSAVIVGAEAGGQLMRAMREGQATDWPEPPANPPDRLLGTTADAGHPAEAAAGLLAPITYYPLFENALRVAGGVPPDIHRSRLGALWARFAAVAAENPHAWAREAPGADEIATASPGNRMACFPYTKLMTANFQVDQGAALLLCSAGAAAAAGIPRERWVFVHAVATANDRWYVGERDRLDRSPALAACARAALGHAGAGIDDFAHVDLYSCFPSAVQVAATELGFDLDDERAPTVTGGLTFGGGPGNNYVTHAVAALVERIRDDADGSLALATGVGWYLTKHAIGLFGGEPPSRGFALFDPQDEVDRLPGREIADTGSEGEAQLEAYTAVYERDGRPKIGSISGLLADGRRAFAKTEDEAALAALVEGDPAGLSVRLDSSGGFELAG